VIFASRKGPVAEWLGRALQKLLQRFESARDLDTKPLHESEEAFLMLPNLRKQAFVSWGALKKPKHVILKRAKRDEK
ncbi:MAG: hypothetical protein RL377_1167, partial [Bacteroidota bacterium]